VPTIRNWAGNREFRPARLLEPRSIDELQDQVRSSRRLRPLGSRHSFNDLVDTSGDLLSLGRLPHVFELDPAGPSVTVDGAVRYGDLCPRLDAAGFALHNLASLPHISVAGACATGTHGSGDRNGSLATSVAAVQVVDGDGDLRTFTRGDPEFPGTAVALGALGVVVRLTLDLEPAFQVRQVLYERLPESTFADRFDQITGAAHSVSLFTRWREPAFDQVWLKQRTGEGDEVPRADLFGAAPATVELHPIRELSAAACTPQLGVEGPWYERLPHFRLDHTPSAGNELQSEYFVARDHAVPALAALGAVRDQIAPQLMVAEIRTIAADALWLSPAQGRDSVAFHFSWLPDWDAVREMLPVIEAALEPFEPRPHWGKLFTMPWSGVQARYPKLPAFRALASRLDPSGTFRNAYLDGLLA
jgi:xylitol oxidase